MNKTSSLPIAVIGAGPVGLAAAAHLVARGIKPIVFERGPGVGYAVRQWAHVRLFSPWRYNIDMAAAELLIQDGWQPPPPDDLPTGQSLLEHYLKPLAECSALRDHIYYHSYVIAVGRRDFDKVKTAGREQQPFVLTIEGAAGEISYVEVAGIIDASGTWFTPNPLGAGGLPVPGERQFAQRIHYGIPNVLGADRERYANRRVLVVGSGHSALNTLLDLVELRKSAIHTEIVWALRRDDITSSLGGGANDALPGRGALGQQTLRAVQRSEIEIISPFRARWIESGSDAKLRIGGLNRTSEEVITADEIVVATGFRPDHMMLREVRVNLDPWLESPEALAPLIDPNLHSCGTVQPHGMRELAHLEADFYIVGMKSYGRAPTFLLSTGYEQVRSIAAAFAGDMAAAERVELELPETGVCAISPSRSSEGALDSCCNPIVSQMKNQAADCSSSPVVEEHENSSSCCG